MPAESVLDGAVQQALVSEAAQSVQSMTRGWNAIDQGIVTSQINFLNVPTVLAGQGIRMLNGTPTMAPGNAPNANA